MAKLTINGEEVNAEDILLTDVIVMLIVEIIDKK